MIRGTLTRGLNHPENAKHSPRKPTASFQIRRKGKDSKKPNPRPMYTVRPLRAPSNPRGNLRLARGPPAKTLDKRLTFPLRSRVVSLPSRDRIDSASLEGREPTLGGADRLRLAQGHPSTEETNGPSARPPRCTEALNANHSLAAPGSDDVRPPFPTVAVTGVPSANSGHCSAIPGTVATLWEPVTLCETCSALLQPPCCQLPVLPSCFPLRRTLKRHGHDPRKRPRP